MYLILRKHYEGQSRLFSIDILRTLTVDDKFALNFTTEIEVVQKERTLHKSNKDNSSCLFLDLNISVLNWKLLA